MQTPIKNSDNPRFSQDEQGQWWYRTLGAKRLPRIRADVRVCDRCGVEFLGHARTKHASTKSRGHFCGILCANRSIKFELRNTKRGPKSRNWRGGRRQTKQGYIQVWAGDRDRKNKNNYVYEHRLVMEGVLGRRLLVAEHVHHVNGVRSDNRKENLEVWTGSHPPGQRVEDKLAWAREFIAIYAQDPNRKHHCPTCTCC